MMHHEYSPRGDLQKWFKAGEGILVCVSGVIFKTSLEIAQRIS